jgi:hypothetical protein
MQNQKDSLQGFDRQFFSSLDTCLTFFQEYLDFFLEKIVGKFLNLSFRK